MFYSKSTGGFYSHEIHGTNIPSDAVEITAEYHHELLQGQSEGKQITADENGYPILVYPQQTPEQILAEQIAEAKQYLESTDHKFLVGYVTKGGEDLDAILALRNEKRWFIRANE